MPLRVASVPIYTHPVWYSKNLHFILKNISKFLVLKTVQKQNRVNKVVCKSVDGRISTFLLIK